MLVEWCCSQEHISFYSHRRNLAKRQGLIEGRYNREHTPDVVVSKASILFSRLNPRVLFIAMSSTLTSMPKDLFPLLIFQKILYCGKMVEQLGSVSPPVVEIYVPIRILQDHLVSTALKAKEPRLYCKHHPISISFKNRIAVYTSFKSSRRPDFITWTHCADPTQLHLRHRSRLPHR